MKVKYCDLNKRIAIRRRRCRKFGEADASISIMTRMTGGSALIWRHSLHIELRDPVTLHFAEWRPAKDPLSVRDVTTTISAGHLHAA
jgi:hypothetical protein